MNQLALIEKMTPAEIYAADKIDVILTKIKEEVAAVKPDLSTDKGRREIASLAYKVAQSKTFMDDCGKRLGEEAKKTLDAINAERKKVRDTLDNLKDEVRKPLTEWEKAERDRCDVHMNEIERIKKTSTSQSINWQTLPIDELQSTLKWIQTIDRNWEEFHAQAAMEINLGIERMGNALDRRLEYDAQQSELKRLREAEAKRQREDELRLHNERVLRDKAEAEAMAKRDAEVKEEQARAAETARLEREKELAEEKTRAIQREKDLAEQRAKAAAEKAERDKIAAVEAERERLKKVEDAKIAAERAREANTKHRAKINNQVLAALAKLGVDEETGKKIITAIVTGDIPHTKVIY